VILQVVLAEDDDSGLDALVSVPTTKRLRQHNDRWHVLCGKPIDALELLLQEQAEVKLLNELRPLASSALRHQIHQNRRVIQKHVQAQIHDALEEVHKVVTADVLLEGIHMLTLVDFFHKCQDARLVLTLDDLLDDLVLLDLVFLTGAALLIPELEDAFVMLLEYAL